MLELFQTINFLIYRQHSGEASRNALDEILRQQIHALVDAGVVNVARLVGLIPIFVDELKKYLASDGQHVFDHREYDDVAMKESFVHQVLLIGILYLLSHNAAVRSDAQELAKQFLAEFRLAATSSNTSLILWLCSAVPALVGSKLFTKLLAEEAEATKN